ncbi:hypothetical protein TW95_gp0519 [Pandoravirus inopinatum]|uniref:Uncharacterized protein n=1 Tax=Pandoravirus inopinatum TaxID=1605721 RepID=A0A0B5IX12_9VIRU|nr:hypothetical protein TW95_gp0519 [Pandoravirus inopinatum]AJF97253.1 hypothetical protein [Pandoravirus inopinatum]
MSTADCPSSSLVATSTMRRGTAVCWARTMYCPTWPSNGITPWAGPPSSGSSCAAPTSAASAAARNHWRRAPTSPTFATPRRPKPTHASLPVSKMPPSHGRPVPPLRHRRRHCKKKKKKSQRPIWRATASLRGTTCF